MSTRLALRILERPDADDPFLPRIRLLLWVSFLTWDGTFSLPELAIIDTGAPLSLIPHDVWQGIRYLKVRNDVIQGIVPHSECDLDVIDGVINCVLQDDLGRSSEVVTIRAHLAPTDDVPLLLGFGGLLDQANLYFSLPQSQAYLEI